MNLDSIQTFLFSVNSGLTNHKVTRIIIVSVSPICCPGGTFIRGTYVFFAYHPEVTFI